MKKQEIRDNNVTNTTSTGSNTFKSTGSLYDITNDKYEGLNYDRILPKNIDIFRVVVNELKTIADENVRHFITKLINSLKQLLVLSNDINTITSYLSTLRMVKMDDGSVLLEWNYIHFRIGFSIEPNIQESSYYIVTDNRIDGSYTSLSKPLKFNELNSVLQGIIQFTLGNT